MARFYPCSMSFRTHPRPVLHHRLACRAALIAVLFASPAVSLIGQGAPTRAEPPEQVRRTSADEWVQSMKKVHARFTGTKGTFAHFGDSITVTMAFWTPLAGTPKNMNPEMAR